jgi:GPI mannosyltransferase 3
MKHLLNNKYLYFVIFLGLILHILSVHYSIGFYSDDEHFQILEITAYLMGINEVAINDPTGHYWEWEDGIRMRPWFQPYIYFKIISFLRSFYFDDPFIWAYFLRIIAATLGFISILYLFFIFKNFFFKKNTKFNYFIYFTFWFYPFLHSRTSSENLSISLFILSFCIIIQIINKKEKNFNYLLFSIGSFFMGLSMVVKFTTVFNAFPFFLWLLINKFNIYRLLIFSFFVLTALLVGLYIDYINWGSFKNTYYQFYKHNLSSGEIGRMKYFGIDPWYYYFLEIIKQLAPPLSLFFLIGIIFYWIKNLNNVFTWVTLIAFLIFSYISHKEIRYIFPLYIFAPFFIAYFLDKFSIKYITGLIKVLIVLSNIIFLIITIFTPPNSKVGVYKYIFDNLRNEQKIFYIGENPYLVNNMEPFFYTKFLPKINKLENDLEKDGNKWIISNDYNSIKNNLQNKCKISYTTYPKKLIDLNENWKRLKLNWYIINCR